MSALFRFYVGRRANDEQDIAKIEAFPHEQFGAFTVFEGAGTWKGERIPTTVYECFGGDKAPDAIAARLADIATREAVAWVSISCDSGVSYSASSSARLRAGIALAVPLPGESGRARADRWQQ